MAAIQREYKDRLFNFIFGSEENKAWTLSLYNAIILVALNIWKIRRIFQIFSKTAYTSR